MTRSLFLLLLFLVPAMAFAQVEFDDFSFTLPDDRKWQKGSDQQNDTQHLAEWIPAGETFENWTILVNLMLFKKIQNTNIDEVIDVLKAQIAKDVEQPVITILEKDVTAKVPWVLLTVEAPKYKKGGTESQLYYLFSGPKGLYYNFVALKKSKLPAAFVAQWSKIFKNGTLPVTM